MIFAGQHLRSAFSIWGFLLLIFCGKEAFSQGKGEGIEKPAAPEAQPEKLSRPSPAGVGVLDIPRPDGSKDRIYYSIITPEEESQRSKEEKEKSDRSWEMLKNVIIDKRPK
jgi:hypothetical protein